MPYATNFLPGISNIVALPEDGQVFRSIGQYIKYQNINNFVVMDGLFFIFYVLSQWDV